MTVSVSTGQIWREQRVTPGLPKGVEVFSMYATVTSSSGGGNNDTIFEFNRGSGRTFQPYVCITKIEIEVTVADPTDGVAFALPSSWERTTRSLAGGLPPVQLLNTSLANGNYYVRTQENVLLGRAQLGTPGAFYVRFPEVDTAVHGTYIEGLISDIPFMLPGDMAF